MLNLYILEPEPALSADLAHQTAVHIVGSGSLGDGAPGKAIHCDLVLASARFPRDELVQFLERSLHDARTVIVDAEETEEAIVPLLEAGAVGYVRRGASADEMIATLQAIHAGKLPLAPPIGTALVERIHALLALQQQRAGQALEENCPDLTLLSAREREILTLIRNGASNREIAQELTIELGTVKNHVHNILKKLNVSRRDQAALYVDLFEQTAQTPS